MMTVSGGTSAGFAQTDRHPVTCVSWLDAQAYAAGRPRLEQRQPGLLAALEGLVDPLTRGDPTSPLRWTCKSRAKLASGLAQQGWRVSSTIAQLLSLTMGAPYRLQSEAAWDQYRLSEPNPATPRTA